MRAVASRVLWFCVPVGASLSYPLYLQLVIWLAVPLQFALLAVAHEHMEAKMKMVIHAVPYLGPKPSRIYGQWKNQLATGHGLPSRQILNNWVSVGSWEQWSKHCPPLRKRFFFKQDYCSAANFLWNVDAFNTSTPLPKKLTGPLAYYSVPLAFQVGCEHWQQTLP